MAKERHEYDGEDHHILRPGIYQEEQRTAWHRGLMGRTEIVWPSQAWIQFDNLKVALEYLELGDVRPANVEAESSLRDFGYIECIYPNPAVVTEFTNEQGRRARRVVKGRGSWVYMFDEENDNAPLEIQDTRDANITGEPTQCEQEETELSTLPHAEEECGDSLLATLAEGSIRQAADHQRARDILDARLKEGLDQMRRKHEEIAWTQGMPFDDRDPLFQERLQELEDDMARQIYTLRRSQQKELEEREQMCHWIEQQVLDTTGSSSSQSKSGTGSGTGQDIVSITEEARDDQGILNELVGYQMSMAYESRDEGSDDLSNEGSDDSDEEGSDESDGYTEAQQYVWDYRNEIWDVEENKDCDAVGLLYAGVIFSDGSIVVHPPCKGIAAVMRYMTLESFEESEPLNGSSIPQTHYAISREALEESLGQVLGINEFRSMTIAQEYGDEPDRNLEDPESPFALHHSETNSASGTGSGTGGYVDVRPEVKTEVARRYVGVREEVKTQIARLTAQTGRIERVYKNHQVSPDKDNVHSSSGRQLTQSNEKT